MPHALMFTQKVIATYFGDVSRSENVEPGDPGACRRR